MRLNEMFFCKEHPFEKGIVVSQDYFVGGGEIIICQICCKELPFRECHIHKARAKDETCSGCKAIENVTLRKDVQNETK